MKQTREAHIVLKVCIFLTAAFLFSQVAAAEKEPAQAQPQTRTHLRAAIFTTAPWGMLANGSEIGTTAVAHEAELDGIMPSMVRAVSETIGEPIELVPVSYARMFSLLKTGEVDFAFFFRSEASEKVAIPLVETLVMKTVLVARPETVSRLNGQLTGLVIASPISIRYSMAFDSRPDIQKVYVNDFTQAVRLLVRGRVGAVAGPVASLVYSFRKEDLNPENFAILYEINTNRTYLQYSKNSPLPQKMDAIVAAAQKHTKSGLFQSFMDHFVGEQQASFKPLTASK
ncbi:MAG: hypothetical protein COB37_00830 [Kordiimonadales bacterium]|nr:MAG: hypothetical protein COB37_00830 [Kordiimonadales bacterium]